MKDPCAWAAKQLSLLGTGPKILWERRSTAEQLWDDLEHPVSGLPRVLHLLEAAYRSVGRLLAGLVERWTHPEVRRAVAGLMQEQHEQLVGEVPSALPLVHFSVGRARYGWLLGASAESYRAAPSLGSGRISDFSTRELCVVKAPLCMHAVAARA